MRRDLCAGGRPSLQRSTGCLTDWPEGGSLMFCDEGRAGAAQPSPRAEPGPWRDPDRPRRRVFRSRTRASAALPYAVPVSLGPRILRADTAAVAALTLWQATLGDWR